MRRAAAWAGGVGLTFAALFGAVTLSFGSVDAALSYLRGERLSVRPGIVDAGRGTAGDQIEATVEVVNHTDRAVRLIGGTSDCSCMAVRDIPLELVPGERRPVSVRVRLPHQPGAFDRKAWFLTDDKQTPVVVFGLTVRIDPPASAGKNGE